MKWAAILLVALFPAFGGAQEQPSVVINEIAWMGTEVQGVAANQHWRYEWLELFNQSENSLLLDGWTIEVAQNEVEFVIPLSGTILAQGYVLVASSDKVSGADVNYANLGGKLTNSGMKLTLKDGLGNVVDETDARDGWPQGDNETKRTMERTGNRNLVSYGNQVSTPQEWQTSADPGGTPKAGNSSGFKEQNPAQFSELYGASKKDSIAESFQKRLSLLNEVTLSAVVLAVGSVLLVLGLRRKLFQGAKTFDAPQD